jgi:PKD repeat protein
MLGKLTDVRNVKGEHRGQRVQRTWFFIPRCPTGSCQRVTLVRKRSGKHIRDVLLLKRRRPNVYRGTGHFWIALKCAGQVIQHGGRATETITVRITRARVTGTDTFAAGIKATYDNPRRVNLTKCPGGIGHDAATYGGTLTTTASGQPTAGFTVVTDPSAAGASFTDRSTPGLTGAAIVTWSWNFGDPASTSNTSTLAMPMHQYSAHGTYTVTLQVQDEDGQLASITQQVTV